MGPRFNLIIFHTPFRQGRADFAEITENISVRAPDIVVYVISEPFQTEPDFWNHVAKLPTLLFSPLPLTIPPQIRGTRRLGQRYGKLEEMQLLQNAGLPIPEAIEIKPDTKLDPATWGPFVVVKPYDAWQGQGVTLRRTKHVRYVDPLSWPEGDSRRGSPLIAQRFVPTGEHLQSWRVHTVFGRPTYAITSISSGTFDQPDPTGDDDFDIPVATQAQDRRIMHSDDPAVLALAKRAQIAFPQAPTLGVDIVKHADTGEFYILEVNSGVPTWHISSRYGLAQQLKYGLDHKSQFGALDIITDAMISATRRDAS
jgi:hypothetical protein